MAASDDMGSAITRIEDGDSSKSDDEKGNNLIPTSQFLCGQELKLGIVNQYGQLMGEYSRLDDDLWLSNSLDDEPVERTNEELQWGLLPSWENRVELADRLHKSVCDGSMVSVEGKSSFLKDNSYNQHQGSSPVSVLRTRMSDIDVKTRMHPQSQHHQPMKHNSLGTLQSLGIRLSRGQIQTFQSESENLMKSSVVDESDNSISAKEIRTRTISDLLELDYEPAAKKCLHCKTTQTPQWRTGPMGRKTLCNACGVQYKHGRLFPNYRPLRSPTFDPSLHTYLPKRVQDMRSNPTKRCPIPIPKPKKVEKTPKFGLSHSTLDKKIQEMILGKTLERCPISTHKPNEVEETSSEFDPSLGFNLDNEPQEMILFDKIGRHPYPTPKPNEIEERVPDLNVSLNSSCAETLEMRIDNISGRQQRLTFESERVEEMRLDNNNEKDQNRAQRAKKFEDMRLDNNNEKYQNRAQRAKKFEEMRESNHNFDSNSNLKRKRQSKAVKMCLHCESTRTPQWRPGPMGRNTLCNACGVQFRNGRLFPEYRPLNSPTYDPLLHSHLPKQVEKMRMSKVTTCTIPYQE
ncbi:uncharacterized protein LOC130807475 [Amaranthus tricolor]|uniref:uncharacterized protein LOC130807475 n=1 Tax=Amaranthus tricolor TaxID=29722 RepID=UPI0025860956|nr:uncharacterized protein LOC130807475 [Amaranthus tricolor]